MLQVEKPFAYLELQNSGQKLTDCVRYAKIQPLPNPLHQHHHGLCPGLHFPLFPRSPDPTDNSESVTSDSCVFTALHALHATRSSHEEAVCPSVDL